MIQESLKIKFLIISNFNNLIIPNKTIQLTVNSIVNSFAKLIITNVPSLTYKYAIILLALSIFWMERKGKSTMNNKYVLWVNSTD